MSLTVDVSLISRDIWPSHAGTALQYSLPSYAALPLVITLLSSIPLVSSLFSILSCRLVAEHHRAGCIVQQQTLADGKTTELTAALQKVFSRP